MAGGHGKGFYPFQVDAAHLAYTILGGFVVLFGMFSLLIKEKLYIGEAPIATVFGIIIGPYGAGIFDPRGWGSANKETADSVTLEVTRVVLAVGVFAIGVELPKQYMRKHWKSLFYLLGPVMTYGWFVSAALIYGLVPGLSFLSSLVIAACLTPTDPILAAAVVGGKYAQKHVPTHIRHMLAAESGCNDGAAFPFLFIAIYLILEDSDAHAVGEWFYMTWLYEVALGIVIGAALGFSFRHLMKFCERKGLIDRHSYVAQYISLAMLAIGITTLLGSDDLLAAFSCGTAFAWDGWFNKQTEESQFSNVIDLLFNCACFIYIGAWIPFSDFEAPEFTLSAWRLVVIALLVMLLRRLPVILALYKFIPDIRTFREALFTGHFGPIGVGAVFISTLASMKLPVPHNPPQNQVDLLGNTIQPIVAFMVLISIAIHGLSIPFFSFGRRVHSVTRTWSRRYSMDPTAPEWANQVRRAPSRPEDIIVNRDHRELEEKKTPTDSTTSREDRMEKGIVEPDETLASGSGAHGEPGSRVGSRPQTPQAAAAEEELGATGIPPGGSTEWREGPDLVVESEIGSGEDVQVKVFRNAFQDEHGRFTEDVGTKVREEVEKFKHECRKDAKAAAALMQRLKSSESQPGGEAKPEETADEWQDIPATEADTPQGTEAPITIEEPPSTSQTTPKEKGPAKKAKHSMLKAPAFIHSRSSGRRRESVRQSLFGKRTAGGIQDAGEANAEARQAGTSSLANSTSSSAAASATDLVEPVERGRQDNSMRLNHSRASSLRPLGGRLDRGESPMRAIRFAGDHSAPRSRIHSRTPSYADIQTAASTTSPVSGSSGQDNSRAVMFDLPPLSQTRSGGK